MIYFIDTNILIDLASTKNSAPFFEKIIEDQRTSLVTSTICIAEYLTKASPAEERFIKNFVESGNLEVVGFQFYEEAEKSAHVRKKLNLKLPDAVLITTCERLSATLLTHDKELLQKAKKIIKATDPF